MIPKGTSLPVVLTNEIAGAYRKKSLPQQLSVLHSYTSHRTKGYACKALTLPYFHPKLRIQRE